LLTAAYRTSPQVLDELNKLPKSINRQVYVNRIMDIVKNLEKQKADIQKVLTAVCLPASVVACSILLISFTGQILVDVRRVQKDINSTSETSKRSFAVADEVVYQAAKTKKDPFSTQAYKNVIALREVGRAATLLSDV
jgi:predicted ribonuclease YlaK